MLYPADAYEKLRTSCANLVSPNKLAKRRAAVKSTGLTLSRCPGKSCQGTQQLQSSYPAFFSMEESSEMEEYASSVGG